MEHPPNTMSWPMCQQAAVDPGSIPSYLDFLSDELLGGSGDPLDSGTLAAVAAAQGADKQRKRVKREASGLLDSAGNDGSNEEDLSDDEEEDPTRKGGKRKSSVAAQNKANREKARREKINDRFTELAKLVDPSNEPKTDKLSILGEAIRFVQQTQVENCQLKQLNKFLEEKVGQLEKERAQTMYQMYQYNGQMMQPAAGAAGMMAPMLMPGMAPAAMQQQVMQHAALQQMMPPAGAAAAGCSTLQQPQMAALQQQQMVLAAAASGELQQQAQQPDPQQQPQQQLVIQLQQQPDAQQQQLPVLQQQQQPFMQGKAVMTAMAGPGMPMPYWQSMMPASMLDSTQDSLLRPPAA